MTEYFPLTHVAIRFKGTTYSLPAPNRHHDVIRHIVQTTGVSHVDSRDEDQGFLDSSGRYLTRLQAYNVARKLNLFCPGVHAVKGLLFSENVW